MHYRIHRIKEAPRESFRWASHAGGLAIVKLKDYDTAEDIESPSPYAAWQAMREKGADLRPGDVLEQLEGAGQPASLLILKYVGFEPAQWFFPTAKEGANVENRLQYSRQDEPAQSFQ